MHTMFTFLPLCRTVLHLRSVLSIKLVKTAIMNNSVYSWYASDRTLVGLKNINLYKTFCSLTESGIFTSCTHLELHSTQEVCMTSLCFSIKTFDLPLKENIYLSSITLSNLIWEENCKENWVRNWLTNGKRKNISTSGMELMNISERKKSLLKLIYEYTSIATQSKTVLTLATHI